MSGETGETPEWMSGGNENPAAHTPGEPVKLSLAVDNDDNGGGRGGKICFVCSIAVSLLLFAAFIYSAYVQFNDPDPALWTSFYVLHAILVVLALIPMPVLARGVFALAGVTAIFSIVLIVLNAIELSKGGLDDEESHRDGTTKTEELSYELAGASIGLFSALFHSCLAYRRRRQNGADSVEGEADANDQV